MVMRVCGVKDGKIILDASLTKRVFIHRYDKKSKNILDKKGENQ